MTRLKYNGLSAALGAALTATGTAVTFDGPLTHSGGVAVPTLTGTDYIPLSIMSSLGKLSEIVYLTAYTAGASTGTITRGQEGTSAVAFPNGNNKVIHSPTVSDILAVSTPSGGGGGGSKMTVASVRLPASLASGTIPTGDTVVPGLTTTINVPFDQTVMASFEVIHTAEHENRFTVYVDGVNTHANGGQNAVSSVHGGGNDYWASSTFPVALTAGTHTVDVRWNASSSTGGVTFYMRSLAVLYDSGTSGGGGSAPTVAAEMYLATGSALAAAQGNRTVTYDTLGAHNDASFTCSLASGTITVSKDGWYYAEAHARCDGTTGEFSLTIQVPSTTGGNNTGGNLAVGSTLYDSHSSGMIYLTAGQTVSATLFSGVSTAIKSPGADHRTYLRLTYLSGGGSTSSTPNKVFLSMSSAPVIASATLTTLSWDTEVVDQGAMHDPANPTRITCPAGGDGDYLVIANVSWNQAGTQIQTRINKNGALYRIQAGPAGTNQTGAYQNLMEIVPMVAGDYLEIAVYQASGVNQSPNAGGSSGTFVQARRMA